MNYSVLSCRGISVGLWDWW